MHGLDRVNCVDWRITWIVLMLVVLKGGSALARKHISAEAWMHGKKEP